LEAAVTGTGFIGLVLVEALRRLGVEAAAIVGSSPQSCMRRPNVSASKEKHGSLNDVGADNYRVPSDDANGCH